MPSSETRDTSPQRIVVVGGGVAGLVAARELSLGGAAVTLIEACEQLGGRVASAPLHGHAVDVGAEAFATRGGEVQRLITELGLAQRVVAPAPLGSWVYAEGVARPLPKGGALGIPASPMSAESRRVLGFGAALRATLEPLRRRATPTNDETTVASLVTERLGARVLERLVRPIALGVYSTEPTELRLAQVPGLREAFDRSGSLVGAARELRAASSAAGGAVAALAGGMTPLVAALEADLLGRGCEIVRGTQVVSLVPPFDTEPSWQVQDAEVSCLASADAVVIAAPERAARDLLGGLLGGPGHAAPAPSDIEVIALAVHDERLDAAPRGTGVLVAPGDPRVTAKALTHATAKWPDRAAVRGAGEHVLRLSYGRTGSAPETAALADADAFALALRDASLLLGIELAPESLADAVRQPWSVSPPPGARPEPQTPATVALAGDWVHGTGLASVVAGARGAANDLLGRLAPLHPTDPSSTPHEESTVRPA